jgi:hypothetical protein
MRQGKKSLIMDNPSRRWYSPAPSEISVSRFSLDFGLRSADLFFRELVVPELGRTWFVRQISWPLAALAIHETLRSSKSRPAKPSAICHAIEALACKLEYAQDREGGSERILGTRAFGRDTDSEIWTFDGLRQSTNYVRNTHRQAASRALRTDVGLGFATGLRFDLLELVEVGKELAEVFLRQPVGRGGVSLRNWLLGWFDGERDVASSRKTLFAALSPEQPTPDEQNLVRRRLLETIGPASDKRRRLAHALGRAADAPEDIEAIVIPRLRQAGHSKQANEVAAALSFGAVLDRARDATSVLTRRVEPARSGVPIATLARDAKVRNSLGALKTACTHFLAKAATAEVTESTSRVFSKSLEGVDDEQTIRVLVRRVGQVLNLSDVSVIRGPLFRVVDASLEAAEKEGALEDGAASIEPDRTGRTFRIANLHSLLHDIRRRRTP